MRTSPQSSSLRRFLVEIVIPIVFFRETLSTKSTATDAQKNKVVSGREHHEMCPRCIASPGRGTSGTLRSTRVNASDARIIDTHICYNMYHRRHRLSACFGGLFPCTHLIFGAGIVCSFVRVESFLCDCHFINRLFHTRLILCCDIFARSILRGSLSSLTFG